MRNLKVLFFAVFAAFLTTATQAETVICKDVHSIEITAADQEQVPSLDYGLNEAGQPHLVWFDLNLEQSAKVTCDGNEIELSPPPAELNLKDGVLTSK